MKQIVLFMSILLCLMTVGIVSYTASYSNAFGRALTVVDRVTSAFATPFRSVLNILGISRPAEHQFSAYFSMRSTLDNDVIPKNNEFYDELQYSVRFPAENFICSKFNRDHFKNKEDYVSDLVLYFGSDGAFLFGQAFDGRFSPFVDHPDMTVADWQAMFKGSYFDFLKNTAFINAPGLDFDYEFKFEADGYEIGIWS